MERVRNIALGIMTEVLYALVIIALGFLIGGVFYLIFR